MKTTKSTGKTKRNPNTCIKCKNLMHTDYTIRQRSDTGGNLPKKMYINDKFFRRRMRVCFECSVK